MTKDKKDMNTPFTVIEGSKEDLEVELVRKLKAKTISEPEIKELISRVKRRRGHLRIAISNETLH